MQHALGQPTSDLLCLKMELYLQLLCKRSEDENASFSPVVVSHLYYSLLSQIEPKIIPCSFNFTLQWQVLPSYLRNR